MLETRSISQLVTDYYDTRTLCVKRAVDSIREFRDATPDSFSTCNRMDLDLQRESAIDSVVYAFIRSRVTASYHCIKPNLLDLHRFVDVHILDYRNAVVTGVAGPGPDVREDLHSRKKKNGWLRRYRIPLVAQVQFDLPSWSRKDCCVLKEAQWPGQRHNARVLVKADLPCRPPADVMANASQLLRLFHGAMADLYSFSDIGVYLRDFTADKFHFYGYWIPQPEEYYCTHHIVPPPSDPLLVARYGKKLSFLLGAWDEPDDSPLAALVQEFTD